MPFGGPPTLVEVTLAWWDIWGVRQVHAAQENGPETLATPELGWEGSGSHNTGLCS